MKTLCIFFAGLLLTAVCSAPVRADGYEKDAAALVMLSGLVAGYQDGVRLIKPAGKFLLNVVATEPEVVAVGCAVGFGFAALYSETVRKSA